MTKTKSSVRGLADAFKALSDETRLTMLALLRTGRAINVITFAELLGTTHSKASRHLRYLAAAGLVTETRRGLYNDYRLARAEGDAGRVLKAVRGVLADERFAPLVARLEKTGAGRRSTP